MQFDGKCVLLVGSGFDLNGRRLGARIDAPGRWDAVVRLNRLYGAPCDVGRRTEVIFTRWRRWLAWFPEDVREAAQDIIVVNEHAGISAEELALNCCEVGHDAVSIGVHAAGYLLRRGALVEGIGLGWLGGAFMRQKRYPDGRLDGNARYNWRLENEWMARNVRLL